jgi:hypothetical protein
MKKIIFFMLLFVSVPAQAGGPVLVELYTSQGCSSCPPADKFAGVLAKRADVVILTLPVTYWDRLGWKDSLAKPQWTQRQRYYSRAMGKRIVYTPQMVIDGKFHTVGSSRRKVFNLIEKRKKENSAAPNLKLEQRGQKLLLSLDARKLKNPLTLWRIDFIKEKSVAIGAGENSGETVTYYHVAKHLSPLRNWNGKKHAQALTIKKGFDGVAVFLQEKNYGEVFASASVLLK